MSVTQTGGEVEGPVGNQPSAPNMAQLGGQWLTYSNILRPERWLEGLVTLLRPILEPPTATPPLSRQDSEWIYFPDDPPVASGGTSELYVAYRSNGLKLAMKRPRISIPREDILRRFHREAEIWSALEHPNILPYYGILPKEHHLYIISPWRSLGDLLDFVRERIKRINAGELEPSCIYSRFSETRTVCEIAAGLHYLHSMGVTHGDMKAKNVLLTDEGCAQICDFGLTKTLDHAETSVGLQGFGTTRWQSPELLDEGPKSAKSDVYAFGMTIVEVLTANHPFPHIKGSITVATAVLHGERPAFDPMRLLDVDFEPLWKLARYCWVTDPMARPQMKNVLAYLNTRELWRSRSSIQTHVPLLSDHADDPITSSKVALLPSSQSALSFAATRYNRLENDLDIKAKRVLFPLDLRGQISVPVNGKNVPMAADNAESPLSLAVPHTLIRSAGSLQEGLPASTRSPPSPTNAAQMPIQASEDSGYAEGTLGGLTPGLQIQENKIAEPSTPFPVVSLLPIRAEKGGSFAQSPNLLENSALMSAKQTGSVIKRRPSPKLIIRTPNLAALPEKPLPKLPPPSPPNSPSPLPPPSPPRHLDLLTPSYLPLPQPKEPSGSAISEPPSPKQLPNLTKPDIFPMPLPSRPPSPQPRSPRRTPNLLPPEILPMPQPPLPVSPLPAIPSFPDVVMFTSPEQPLHPLLAAPDSVRSRE